MPGVASTDVGNLYIAPPRGELRSVTKPTWFDRLDRVDLPTLLGQRCSLSVDRTKPEPTLVGEGVDLVHEARW